MRIIAGTHRSRSILPPPGDMITRPITDRTKQSLFDRLVAMEAMGGNVVDVFSGTGSLGLEALSRGADHCTFIERDRTARDLLKRNLDALGFAQRAQALSVDGLSANWVAMLRHTPVRLVFLDPPYSVIDEDESGPARIESLIAALAPAMEEDGVLVLRTSARAAAPSAHGWVGPESHLYGTMTLHFYQLVPG